MAFSQPLDPGALPTRERLERVAENAPVGLFEADCGGGIVFANARWSELLAVEGADALGHEWLNAFEDADRVRLETLWSRTAECGEAAEFQGRLRGGPDTRFIRIWLAPVRDESGRLLRFSGAASDVTRFADAAAQLSTSREQFRSIAEAMPHLAWIAEPSGNVEYFNQPWLDYTGVTVGQMIQAGPKSIVHPDDLSIALERWESAIRSGRSYEIEYRLRSGLDGTYRWFLARALPVRDESGRIVKWIGTATDIDAQVRTNANLRFVLDAAASLYSLLEVRDICSELARLAIARVADWCFITLVDEAGGYQTPAAAHRDPKRLSFVESIREHYPIEPGSAVDDAVHNRVSLLMPSIDPQMLRDAAKNPEHLAVLESLQMHSAIVVPIATESGEVHGAMTVVTSESAHSFTAEDLAVFEMVARRAGTAIENAKAYDKERRRSARLRFIARASEVIFESFDLQATFDSVTELIVSEMADLAYIMLIENSEALRTVSSAHRDPQKARVANRLRGQRTFRPKAEELAIRMLAQERSELHTRLSDDDVLPAVWDYLTPEVKELEIRSAITIPLYSRGETFGALVVYWCQPDRSYTEEDVAIFEDLGRRISIAIEHSKTLERERKISQALQTALLPQADSFPSEPALTFQAEYRPSSHEADVGGDWYDAVEMPDGSIVVSVGDVTGRGLRAAGLMGKLRQALGMASLYETDPARLLDSVDVRLRRQASTAIATAFVGIISPDRKTLRYASAGHPPPLLRRAGKLVEISSSGLPIGLRDLDREDSREISLEGAELLILYTDGLTEATRDLAFGERRLRSVSASGAVLYVRSAARFICDACLPIEAQDDTAVLTVRFGESAQWTFDAENARAAHEARAELMAYLRGQAPPESDFEAAELVFGELVGNVVRHAPGPIDVQVDWSGRHPVLHVTDRGKGVVRAPSLPENPLSEGGRGLYIMSLLTHSLRVERIPGYGNHIAAELRLQRR